MPADKKNFNIVLLFVNCEKEFSSCPPLQLQAPSTASEQLPFFVYCDTNTYTHSDIRTNSLWLVSRERAAKTFRYCACVCEKVLVIWPGLVVGLGPGLGFCLLTRNIWSASEAINTNTNTSAAKISERLVTRVIIVESIIAIALMGHKC